ncbi:hypothetical protein Tco_0066860 [Tanacetum coccineum]
MMQSMSMLVKIQDRKAEETKRQSQKTMTKAQDQISQSMKEQDYNVERDKDHKSLMTKSNLINLTKECHNELTSGEIGETPLEAKKLCDQVKDRMHGGNTLWCRGSYGAKEEDVANFKTKRWNCGACKQLVGEGVDLTGDEDPTDEDGDIGVLVSLGVEIFLEGKKSQESNIGDSDNTGDGGKTAGRAIIT